jgi:amino acid adenylation domain-containing protein
VLRPTPRDEHLPLSFAQQRLWFLDQFEPGGAVYNIPAALRIGGLLNVEVLEKSFNEIVRRHEALRTTFSVIKDEAVQIIAPSAAVCLPLVDISGLSERAREEEALRLAAEEAHKPFDLRQGPLFRAALIRLSEQDHVLVLTFHHIVFDGWSTGVFYRELSMLYRCFLDGEASPLPDLPIQYADFALWQRRWLSGEVLEGQLSYWKEQLDGVPALLTLPTDRSRPPRQSYRGARTAIELSEQLTQGLKALGRKEGATLYMTLLAAFQLLLHRYTGQDDIAVGSPIANRNRVEIEELIGFFANTLVLRTKHSNNPTFRELLHRVRHTALEAYAHQDLPFEKLVEELRPERDLSRSPLFQAMFVFQNAASGKPKLAGLDMRPMRITGETTKFDLVLSASEEARGLRAVLQYSTELFDQSTMARMLEHFQTLLESIVSQPDGRISELPILREPERRQLSAWSGTRETRRTDRCLQQVFEEQVARTPERVAICFEGQQLTYRMLNRCADRLARRLRRLGVGPDVLVGLCVERSLELVAGILGILKAGGAYLPLDPSYPQERLEYMLEDSAVAVIVTQRHLAATIPAHGAALVCLDGEEPQDFSDSRSEERDLTEHAQPENLAYVIYTSGSTGKPKGVAVTHHNVMRLFECTQDSFNFTSADVWTLFHSYAFDFSVWEIWGALLKGGKLIIVPSCVTQSADEFVQLIKATGVSILNQTPSAFRQLMTPLMSAAGTERLALRYVILGGEALELQSLRPWFDHFGDEQPKLVNMYGITECSVHVTYRPISRNDLESRAGSVIGRPIPDLGVYILDSRQQLQPVGVPGEIYIGGDGLARGYLRRPDLTAERFIADPLGKDPGGRLYRSGDVGRWLPSGELEYQGRIDDQVKIRGFRIELDEIEAALAAHTQVKEAVVIAREDTPGDKRLIAYVAADGATAADELRNYLRGKLPDYMVPSVFVTLESLPLTSNGKIDRAALPPPDPGRPELSYSYVAPRTQLEATVCEIIAAVLGLKEVGVQDNFFDLGGHSLLAAQVVSRIREALRIDLPLRALFEMPVLASLSNHIETIREREVNSSVGEQKTDRVEAIIP